MKFNKLFVVFSLLCVLFAACRKEHYDVSHVQGVNAEGEVLLPIASKSLTMMDLMQRFEIDSLIECHADGSMAYGFCYEHLGALRGDELLHFKDLSYEQHFTFENPFLDVQVPSFDTMLHFDHSVVFEAEHISVLEAVMRSGHFNFGFESNVGILQRAVIRSSDIMDAEGNAFEMDVVVSAGTVSFDLDGMRFLTETPNTLSFSYDLYFHVQPVTEPELYFDVDILGCDLAIREMRGFVEPYESRNTVDTTFHLFPDNISGSLEVEGARLRLSERNTFMLGARLVVDTALVGGEGITPYSIFEPLPVVADLPPQPTFAVVLDQSLNGKVNAFSSNAFASSNFIVNPDGVSEMVTVADTCNIDVRVDVEIPFAFTVDDIRYLDTVNMNLANIEMPDFIEKLTLELTFNSTLPLNLKGRFFMYDTEQEVITDTLTANERLIAASFDGRPVATTVSIDVTQERVQNVMHSNRIIMMYEVDTDARNVALNADQKLDLFVKAKVKYDGMVEIERN